MAILIYNVDSSAICVTATIVLRFNVIIIIILFKLSGRGRLHNSSLIQGRRGLIFSCIKKNKTPSSSLWDILFYYNCENTYYSENLIKTAKN